MLSDVISYLKFSTEEYLEKKKCGHRERKYIFQKIAVFAAALLWLISAGKLMWGSGLQTQFYGEDRIMAAFTENLYTDELADSVTAGISCFGLINKEEITAALTNSEKNALLSEIAQNIGINRYSIIDSTEEQRQIKTLSQCSAEGDVICKLITYSGKQYIYMGITLKNSIKSVFAYQNILKEICTELEIKQPVSVSFKGYVQGHLSLSDMDRLASSMLKHFNSKIISSNRTDELYTIYAYDKSIEQYIMAGGEKVNINITMRYSENDDRTEVYFATPIEVSDY